MTPTPEQAAIMLDQHCADDRCIRNMLAEYQHVWYGNAGRGRHRPPPDFAEQCRMLTEARAEFEWLRNGSQEVQIQAIRNYDRAMSNWFTAIKAGRKQNKPGFTKESKSKPGFSVSKLRPGNVKRLSRHVGAVMVPKVGWVRFRWSKPVGAVKSYRVTLDHLGRWFIAFVSVPEPVPGRPGTGEVVGVDRGVAVSAALSSGERLSVNRLSPKRQERRRRLSRKLSHARLGSKRREKVRLAVASLKAREKNARKDWCEKLSTDLARRFDIIRIEDLDIKRMTLSGPGKKWLNREILSSGWGIVATRLEQKAPGRVQKFDPAFTSQRCSVCGFISAENRKSQAVFRCVACKFSGNADVNAACNLRDAPAWQDQVAEGHAVTARGGPGLPEPVNREPIACA